MTGKERKYEPLSFTAHDDSAQKYHNNIFIRNVSNFRLSFLIENEES